MVTGTSRHHYRYLHPNYQLQKRGAFFISFEYFDADKKG